MTALALFLQIMLGVAGMALFVYGRKQSRLPQLGVGILLMLTPLAISGATLQLVVGCGLVGLLWFLTHRGL